MNNSSGVVEFRKLVLYINITPGWSWLLCQGGISLDDRGTVALEKASSDDFQKLFYRGEDLHYNALSIPE